MYIKNLYFTFSIIGFVLTAKTMDVEKKSELAYELFPQAEVYLGVDNLYHEHLKAIFDFLNYKTLNNVESVCQNWKSVAHKVFLKNLILQIGTPYLFAGNFDPLSYKTFIKMKETGKLSLEESEALIDHAYKLGNPILYRKAFQLVPVNSYILNFLWIHSKRQNYSKSCHLMGDNDDQFTIQILNPLQDWQSKQPEATMNFWFDEKMVGENSLFIIENTKNKLEKSGLLLENINFRSIRTLDLVLLYPELFTETIPVYWRVDFCKALTADAVMKDPRGPQYVVNIDSDIVAVKREQLFDQKTLYHLQEIGYIFASSRVAQQENSFIILNKFILDYHFNFVIKNSIFEAFFQINKGTLPDNQDVFYKYVNVLRPYLEFVIYQESKGFCWGPLKPGKSMIFPESRFSCFGGYNEQERILLKQALS